MFCILLLSSNSCGLLVQIDGDYYVIYGGQINNVLKQFAFSPIPI